MKRKPLRIKKKGIPFWRSVSFLLFLLVCMGGGALWYALFYSALFSVKDISIQGIQNVSPEESLQIARQIIQSPSFPPRESILFFPSEKISRALSASFPEIKQVAVQRNFFKKIVTLRITERKGIALLCQEQGSCVAVDEEGVAIRKEENRDSLPLFLSSADPVLADRSETLGERALDGSLLRTFLDFKKDLESQSFFQNEGLTVFSFALLDSKKVEARFSEGWVSFINPQDDMDWQKTKLMQVLEKQIPREKRKDLEYIDVRFGDQAYVKYR